MSNRHPSTAEEWAIRLGSGGDASPLSSAERDALARWLVADPERLKQLKSAQLMWQLAGRLTEDSAAKIEAQARALPRNRWNAMEALRSMARPPALAGVAVAAACAALAAVFLKQPDNLNHLRKIGRAHV